MRTEREEIKRVPGNLSSRPGTSEILLGAGGVRIPRTGIFYSWGFRPEIMIRQRESKVWGREGIRTGQKMLPFSLEKLETISFGQRGNRSTCNKLSPDLLEAAFKIRILKEAIHKFMKWATVENFLPTACLFCRHWGGCLELLVTEYPGLWLKMGLGLSKTSASVESE